MKNESKPLRVLVVDDDPLSREVLILLLEHAGYIVSTTDSGDAAVHQLSSTPVSMPNVILADIHMPGTTGSALAHALRDCSSQSVLLAMSGSQPDTEERITRMRQFASSGEDACFRKEAHAIKGSAGMVGAIEIQKLAATFEEDGPRANHVSSLDELMVACNRLSRILMVRNNL
jgi:CheY-like chemotaxis protein